MCCTRLAGNIGRKKSPFWHHRTTLSGYIFATKACINNGKKLLNSNISTCPHNMVNFGPVRAEIVSLVWGTPANFNGFVSWFRYCSDVAQRKPTKLCSIFGRLLGGTLYIHFRGFLPRNRILPDATFTLRPSLAFSYFGSVTARQL